MRTTIGTIALILVLMPVARAADESVGEKVQEAKEETVEATREVGKELRQAGREVKKTGREVRQALITRCADGRHTLKGARGCDGHGGVHDPK